MRWERAASRLGLLHRPGEPAPLFTLTEQRLTLAGVLLTSALLVLGAVLRRTDHGFAGAVATCLGLGLVIALNVVLRRLRPRRAVHRPSSHPGR